MLQRIALVVDADPGRRITNPRRQWLLPNRGHFSLATLSPGARQPHATIPLQGLTLHLNLHPRGVGNFPFDLDGDAEPTGLKKNGVRVLLPQKVKPGDVLDAGGFVVRLVVVDPRHGARLRGDWLCLHEVWDDDNAGIVFGPLSSAERRFAWMSAAVDDDAAARALAADACDVIPAVIDVVRDGAVVHRVFDVEAGFELEDVLARARPAPLSLLASLARELCRAVRVLWECCSHEVDVRAVVDAAGRLRLLPVPWRRRVTPVVDTAFDLDATDVAMLLINSHHERFRALDARRMSVDLGDADHINVREVLDAVEGLEGEDVDVGALVRGLFVDELKDVALLREQLALLDRARL